MPSLLALANDNGWLLCLSTSAPEINKMDLSVEIKRRRIHKVDIKIMPSLNLFKTFVVIHHVIFYLTL